MATDTNYTYNQPFHTLMVIMIISACSWKIFYDQKSYGPW